MRRRPTPPTSRCPGTSTPSASSSTPRSTPSPRGGRRTRRRRTQPASPTCVSHSRTGRRAGLASARAARSASRGSGPGGRTRPGYGSRLVPSGQSPTGGPSPCRWWDHSARWRTPGAWSAWWQRARPASSLPPCPSGGGGCPSRSPASSRPTPTRHRPRAAGPVLTWGSGCSPPSPTTQAPSPTSPTPPPCGPRSPSAAGWGGSSPDASPDRTAIGRRKPSSPGWTAGSCTFVGKPPTSSRAGWRAPTARW